MNSNDRSRTNLAKLHLPIAIQWQNIAESGLSIAAYTDDSKFSNEELQICLSHDEKQLAAALNDPVEHRHFIARRSFQRLFISEILSLNRPPAVIALVHKRDARPVCLDAPDLHLSFSSSGNTMIACASVHKAVGVDIERMRTITNVAALAKRFFRLEEAEALATVPPAEQNLHFLYYWTAKEAALKAIGKGIVFGLNTFSIERSGDTLTYHIRRSGIATESWHLQYLDIMPQHLVAVVENNSMERE